MWVQESNSSITWSNGILASMQAWTTCLGVRPGTRMSAAQPSRCWLVSRDPTASLTALERNAELTKIGLPSRARTCSSSSATRTKLATSVALGVLSRFLRAAISETVNSSRVKLGLKFIVFSTISLLPFPRRVTQNRNRRRACPTGLGGQRRQFLYQNQIPMPGQIQHRPQKAI